MHKEMNMATSRYDRRVVMSSGTDICHDASNSCRWY